MKREGREDEGERLAAFLHAPLERSCHAVKASGSLERSIQLCHEFGTNSERVRVWVQRVRVDRDRLGDAKEVGRMLEAPGSIRSFPSEISAGRAVRGVDDTGPGRALKDLGRRLGGRTLPAKIRGNDTGRGTSHGIQDELRRESTPRHLSKGLGGETPPVVEFERVMPGEPSLHKGVPRLEEFEWSFDRGVHGRSVFACAAGTLPECRDREAA